jgi:DNA-binding MarR family transcriptional regulator
VLGLGLGLVMQVLVLAVQNAVDYSDLGVATSGATLFRSIGGSVGTAILGSIFSSRLSTELRTELHGASVPVGSGGLAHASPAALDKLPPPFHTAYIHAFTNALGTVFVVAAGVAAVAFVLSWALEQRPLRDSVVAGAGIGESFAVPKHTDSLAEIGRALSVLLGREERRKLVARLAARAGVDLSPAACWVVVRLHLEPGADLRELAKQFDVPWDAAERGLAEATERGYVTVKAGKAEVTPAGAEVAEKLIAERRAGLERLLDGWSPEQHTEVAALLQKLARELTGEPDQSVGERDRPVGAAA